MEYRVIRINNDDELMHKKQHKYIDKVRMKNGKYRYIYDVAGFDERDRYEKAKKNYDAAEKESNDAIDAYLNSQDETNRVIEKNQYRNGYYTVSSLSKHLAQQHKQLYDKSNKANEKYTQAWEEHYDAEAAYKKTPLYKLEKRKANKGKNFLNKLFKR